MLFPVSSHLTPAPLPSHTFPLPRLEGPQDALPHRLIGSRRTTSLFFRASTSTNMNPAIPLATSTPADFSSTTGTKERADSASSSDETRAGSQASGRDGGAVNVKEAEAQFDELRRQLTRSSSLYRTQTGQKDSEKEGDDHEDFDLLEYMRSSAAERGQHNFKEKHVGVIWDKLSVTGAGGMKVRSCRWCAEDRAELTLALSLAALDQDVPRRRQGVRLLPRLHGYEVHWRIQDDAQEAA